MTRRKLLANVIGVSFLLLCLLGSAIYWPKVHDVLKDFSGFVVVIAAAYLAYCFQQRQAFLTGLRDLWFSCVEAKADLIDYTHRSEPTEADFQKTARSISIAIDKVRAVYRNVKVSKTSIGLYPFEPLHDMRKALDRLGFADVTKGKQKAERDRIIQAWNALRPCFLAELHAPNPTYYEITPNATDPRRAGWNHDLERGLRLSIGRPIRRLMVIPRRHTAD